MSETIDEKRAGAILRGRFALFGDNPLNAVIAYATDLCEDCQNCTCGTQQPEIRGADMIKRFLNPGIVKKAVKALRGQVPEDDDDG